MKKWMIDGGIVLLAAAGWIHAFFFMNQSALRQVLIILYIGIALIGCFDLVRKLAGNVKPGHRMDQRILSELALLDEEDRVIKQWDIKDKTSLLIGRNQKEESVDIDLTDSEYGALVDYQHAVMNYTSGHWYIEDLNSRNGIRIRKPEDGACYNMAKDKPCKLVKDDVILIANTKLLFR